VLCRQSGKALQAGSRSTKAKLNTPKLVLMLGLVQAVLVSRSETSGMGVATGGAEGAAAPPTFGTGEQAIDLAPPKFEPSALRC